MKDPDDATSSLRKPRRPEQQVPQESNANLTESSDANEAMDFFIPIELEFSFNPASSLDERVRKHLRDCLLGQSLKESNNCEKLRNIATNGLTRPKAQYIDTRLECLGPYLRWLSVLKAVLTQSAPPSTPDSREKNVYSATRKSTILAAKLRKVIDDRELGTCVAGLNVLFQPTWSGKFQRSAGPDAQKIKSILLQRLNKVRKSKNIPELTESEILTKRISAPDELFSQSLIDRYGTWLTTGFSGAKDDVSRLHCEVYVTQAPSSFQPRQEHAKKIVAELLSTTLSSTAIRTLPQTEHIEGNQHFEPVINVWSQFNWTGLRAFATHICLSLARANQNRWRRKHDSPASPIIYIPLSRGSTRQQPISRRVVLRIIGKSYGMTDSQLSDDVPEVNLFKGVRAHLTSSKSILIFDGIECPNDPFGAVFDVLRYTDWISFVRDLLQPDLSAAYSTSDGRYKSKFLLLSNRQIKELTAWSSASSSELPPMGDPNLARELFSYVTKTSSANELPQLQILVEEMQNQIEALWPQPSSRPKSDHGLSIASLYKLSHDEVDYLQGHQNRMPSELDFTLAWCARKSNTQLFDFYRKPFDSKQQVEALRRFLFESNIPLFDSIVLRFIALSVNGLRGDTIQRCIEKYILLEKDKGICSTLEQGLKQISEIETWMNFFFTQYQALLCLSNDEATDLSLERCRWFELHAQADEKIPVDLLRMLDGPASAVREIESFVQLQLLDLRFDEIRELFFAAMLPREACSTPTEIASKVEQFRRMNRILAEESLLQATAFIHCIEERGQQDVYSQRRFIQTIFHGLLSLDIDGDASAQESLNIELTPPPSILSSSLSNDNYKTYIFLYEFVYRRCVERAPAWLLSRSFGRYELKLALLVMFADPNWAREVLSRLHEMSPQNRRFEDFSESTGVSTNVFGSTRFARLPHLRGRVGMDIYKSLLHTANKTGRRAFSAKAIDVFTSLNYPQSVFSKRSLQPVSLQNSKDSCISTELEIQKPSNFRSRGGILQDSEVFNLSIPFQKIAIDSYQAQLKNQAATSLCSEALSRFGINSMDILSLTGESLLNEKGYIEKSDLERRVSEDLLQRYVKSSRTQSELERISDLLFRLGEICASESDFLPTKFNRSELIAEFSKPYAIFWLADRVRSHAATMDSHSLEWPLVSSTAMRYYIRVSLKLSKLQFGLAREEGSNLSWSKSSHARANFNSHEFYVHARDRINVYTRHLYSIPIERVSALLLLAAAARVRGEICSGVDSVSGGRRNSYLAISLQYLERANLQLMQIGYQDGIAKRLLLERVKTLRRLAYNNYDKNYHEIVQADLQTLKKLSMNSQYWLNLVSRLERQKNA